MLKTHPLSMSRYFILCECNRLIVCVDIEHSFIIGTIVIDMVPIHTYDVGSQIQHSCIIGTIAIDMVPIHTMLDHKCLLVLQAWTEPHIYG